MPRARAMAARCAARSAAPCRRAPSSGSPVDSRRADKTACGAPPAPQRHPRAARSAGVPAPCCASCRSDSLAAPAACRHRRRSARRSVRRLASHLLRRSVRPQPRRCCACARASRPPHSRPHRGPGGIAAAASGLRATARCPSPRSGSGPAARLRPLRHGHRSASNGPPRPAATAPAMRHGRGRGHRAAGLAARPALRPG